MFEHDTIKHTGTPIAKGHGITLAASGRRAGKACPWPVWLLAGVVLPAQAAAPDPYVLPTGGTVAAGAARITQSLGHMDVRQTTARAVIDWQTFNLGAQAQIHFEQPSAASVTLNRVHDSQPSQLFGKITGNGQVYLVNPAGLYFSPTASVDVGALVAGTHGMSNADFMAGKTSFTRDGATGSVVNDGNLRSGLAGYVALLAPQVRNGGVITAQAGTVVLAAGEAIALQFDDGAHLARVVVQASDIASLVENRHAVLAPGGTIILSAQAAGQLQAGVVKNSGSLEASGLVSHGGRIFLEASDQISHSGSIAADAAGAAAGQGGTVRIVASLDNPASGSDITGTISARGGALGGAGGMVETSGSALHIGAAVTVDTRASDGRHGSWLLDPNNVVVGANGDIRGATLGANLALGNVVLQSSAGSGAGTGDIVVMDNVSWSANTALTLSAANDVRLIGKLNASGATAGLHILPNTANGRDSASGQGAFKLDGGSVTLSGSGPSLSIGGASYQVINQLGAQGSTSGQDLQGISGNVSGNYALGSDIDASATALWHGGTGFLPLAGFSGTFDGLGHTISNLTIARPAEGNIALFGDTLRGAVLRNIGLVNASISGLHRTGSLVGTNLGAISNSFASGSVTATSNAGGLVGHNEGAITASTSAGVIRADRGGGLVGDNIGSISHSSSSSDVIGNGGTQGNSGGLAGTNLGGVISDSFATGNVSAAAQRAGGLVGFNAGTISASTASGNVAAVGEMVGGLVGWNDHGSLLATSASGSVNGPLNVGGLVGYNSGTIASSYARGDVDGRFNIGGLVGRNEGGSLNNTYASGNVRGIQDVGGLLAYGTGTISNSYATGSASGTDRVGGLLGEGELGLTLSNTYATGRVSGTTNVGGLVGTLHGATVGASYWDTTSSGQAGSSGGIGLSSVQLRQAASYPGWDMAAAWIVYEGYTGPLLRTFMTPLTVTADNVKKTYDGMPYTGGAVGLTYSTAPNGNLLGAPDYPAATDAGVYRLGLYSSQHGYAITFVNGALTIDPRALSLSATRVYDAGTSMSSNVFSLGNLVGGQTLGLSGAASVPSKNVNAGDQPVSLGTLALSDGTGRAANYTLAGGTHTARITPAQLAVTGVAAADKTYDANVTARLLGAATVAALAGDMVTVIGNPVAQFADASAGNGKPVTVSGYALGGADAGNYLIRQPGGLAATIVPAALAVPAPAAVAPSAQLAPVSMVADVGAGNPAPVGIEATTSQLAAAPEAAGSADSAAGATTSAAATEAASAGAAAQANSVAAAATGQAAPAAMAAPATRIAANAAVSAAKRASNAGAMAQATAVARTRAAPAGINHAARNAAPGARMVTQARLADADGLTRFQGSNPFSCMNADLSACAGTHGNGIAALGPIDQQKAAQMAAFDVMTESFDQIPSRHNSGIRHVGKTKGAIEFNETSENTNLVNMMLLFL